MTHDLVKCFNCGEVGSVIETDIPWKPFACFDCGYWGETEAHTDNPQEEDRYHCGQVPHREHAE